MDYASIGERIQHYRKQLGMTQEVFSEKVSLTPHYLSAIERGIKAPSLETLILIVNELGVSANDILVDVLRVGGKIRSSKLADQIGILTPVQQKKILSILEILVADDTSA